MLLYPAMKDLLKNIPSRYLLVNIVAARARKISNEAEQDSTPLTEKPVTLAIEEVASGILRSDNAPFTEERPEEEPAAAAEEAGSVPDTEPEEYDAPEDAEAEQSE